MIAIPCLGSCQCGAVQYELTAKPFVQYACHCSECQKLTSSAFSTCIQVPSESVDVTNGQASSRERVADSGNGLTTSFCEQCSSALFAQSAVRPRIRTIFAGTLDRPHDVEVGAHIWLQSKLPWVMVPAGHRQFQKAGDWSQDYKDAPDRLNL